MTERVVLDASAALEALLNRRHSSAVLDLLETAAVVAAPELYAAEVGNALWKHARAGDVDTGEAHRLVDCALGLLDTTVPIGELVQEALATAVAFDHPIYDALYAVTARRLGASVCTLDRRLEALLREMRIPLARLSGDPLHQS